MSVNFACSPESTSRSEVSDFPASCDATNSSMDALEYVPESAAAVVLY